MTGSQISSSAGCEIATRLNTRSNFPASLRMCVVTIGGRKGRSRATGTRLAKSFGKRYDLFALYLTVTVNPNSVRGERARAWGRNRGRHDHTGRMETRRNSGEIRERRERKTRYTIKRKQWRNEKRMRKWGGKRKREKEKEGESKKEKDRKKELRLHLLFRIARRSGGNRQSREDRPIVVVRTSGSSKSNLPSDSYH